MAGSRPRAGPGGPDLSSAVLATRPSAGSDDGQARRGASKVTGAGSVLYLPRPWIADPARCAAGIPAAWSLAMRCTALTCTCALTWNAARPATCWRWRPPTWWLPRGYLRCPPARRPSAPPGVAALLRWRGRQGPPVLRLGLGGYRPRPAWSPRSRSVILIARGPAGASPHSPAAEPPHSEVASTDDYPLHRQVTKSGWSISPFSCRSWRV
jgi:hypothetical protein